jgi:hypothetical protein
MQEGRRRQRRSACALKTAPHLRGGRPVGPLARRLPSLLTQGCGAAWAADVSDVTQGASRILRDGEELAVHSLEELPVHSFGGHVAMPVVLPQQAGLRGTDSRALRTTGGGLAETRVAPPRCTASEMRRGVGLLRVACTSARIAKSGPDPGPCILSKSVVPWFGVVLPSPTSAFALRRLSNNLKRGGPREQRCAARPRPCSRSCRCASAAAGSTRPSRMAAAGWGSWRELHGWLCDHP